ncbi:MAG: tetratricopeptide repeat protein [Spirochaetes bacterium]|nr:tetratricopeptide repeat protein [Spirochaetota bacterium]
MSRICNILFYKIIIIAITTSGIYPESKNLENQNIISRDSNTEKENKYNFEKNNYFIWIERVIEKNKYRAQKLLDEFNTKYPEHQEMKYYFYYAIIYEHKGEIINAIQNYKKAIAIYPAYSHARNNLGSLYLELERHKESEEQLIKAVEANPYNPFIIYNIGDLYFTMKKFDLAEKYFAKACKYKANYGEAFNKLGLILFNKKEYSRALENLNKALNYNYTHHETYYYIGLSHNKLGRADLAITNIKKAVNIQKNFFQGILELGKIYHSFNEYKSAVKYYLLAEAINCDDVNIRILLCECYNEMKRYDDALDIIENLIKQYPDNRKYIEMQLKIKENQFSGNF